MFKRRVGSLVLSFVLTMALFVPAMAVEEKTSVQAMEDDLIDDETLQVEATALLSKLLERQFKANETGDLIDTSDILADTPGTELYKQYLYWYSGLTDATQEYWTEYDYAVKFDSIEDGTAIFTGDLSYGRAGTIGRSEGYGFEYRVQVVELDGEYYISYIDSGEMNFDGFKTLISNNCNEGIALASEDIDTVSVNKLDALIADYVQLKENDAAAIIDPDDVVDMEAEHEAYLENLEAGLIAELASTSYTYDRERGRRYADLYYSTGNDSCFYKAEANCTNWVSQCVWAAYGGWSDGDSITTMQTNIANRKRMQPSTSMDNWFGHKNGISNPWGNVTHFYNFVTSSPATGPCATQKNDGKKWSGNFVSTEIVTGQVLQVRDGSSGKYAHSVYVTGGTNDSISNILITQNSPYSRIKLDELIRNWGGDSSCYLRQLKFTSANFDK